MQKTRLGLSLLIAVLLFGAILHPSTLMAPYSGDSEHYAITHESSEAYKEHTGEGYNRSDSGIPVASLSADQQRIFEEAKKQERSRSGWQSLGKPPVCTPGLLLCDEYEKFPHTISEENSKEYIFVEDSTGERFLIKIGQGGDQFAPVEPLIRTIIKYVFLGPYALFLAYRGLASRSPEPTPASIGYGAIILTMVFVYPYFLMYTEIPFPDWHLLALPVITWAVILNEI